MIRILYDGTLFEYLTNKNESRTGIFFVAYNILKQLQKRDDIEVELFLEEEQYGYVKYILNTDPDLKNVKIADIYKGIKKAIVHFEYLKKKNKINKESKIIRVFIKTILNLLKFIAKVFNTKQNIDLSAYDIFLTPMNRLLPTLISNSNMKKITVLYDTTVLLFPEYFTGAEEGNHYFLDFVKSIDKYDYYFAISEHTKEDFIKYIPDIKSDTITVTYIAASHNFHPENNPEKIIESRKKYNIPENKKYLFSLCSLEPRKNLIRALKAFIEFINKNNIDDLVYILGGSAWEGFIEKLNKEIPNLNDYKDKIIRAGYIDDEDLPALYSGSEFFIYTSQYEGFGMPPLEAMCCGKAVITSNNSSLPEVVGNAAIMINFDSIEEHVKAYETLYFDKNKANELGEKVLEQAKKFSWENTADIMIRAMKEII